MLTVGVVPRTAKRDLADVLDAKKAALYPS